MSIAHPGRTDKCGGHYCRTRCDYWGEEYGKKHYHGNTSDDPRCPNYAPPRVYKPELPTPKKDRSGWIYLGSIAVIIILSLLVWDWISDLRKRGK